MEKMKKYTEVFITVFGGDKEKVSSMHYQETEGWDSVGHMNLISEIEDTFDIMLDTDDVLALDSFDAGIKIMKKYGVM